MDDKERLIAVCCSLRGRVIDEWIYLEKSIDRFIANHLSHDQEKRYDIMSLLLDRLTFESKRTALKAILDKDDEADGLNKKGKKRPHGNLIEEIRKVNLERNYFAHYYLDTSPDAVKKFAETGEFGFFEFRDSPTKKLYTTEKFNELLGRIHVCMQTLVASAVK